MAIRFWEIYEETKEKYKLHILAGQSGMDNVVGWVHMVEDETIINRFGGEELAVTTGMKAGEEGWLLRLVSSMKKADCSGIIVNTGMYLDRVPEDVIAWCEENSFPLLEMPWEIFITELIQDYCLRIMHQVRKEEQEGLMFERLLKGKDVPEDFLEEIGGRFHLEGTFRIFYMRPKYAVDEKALFHQAILKLENVFGLWQNGTKIRFPYFLLNLKEYYVLAVNDFPEDAVDELVAQIRSLFSHFFNQGKLYLGIGPACTGIHNLHHALGRARIAEKMAWRMNRPAVDFNQMGVFGILFSTEDPEILKSYADALLGPLEEYDRLHHIGGRAQGPVPDAPGATGQGKPGSPGCGENPGHAGSPGCAESQGYAESVGYVESLGYVETLRSYIENDRSLIGVARATYTHRNTVNYRIQNIKRILGNELKTSADLFPYQIAFYIRDMRL